MSALTATTELLPPGKVEERRLKEAGFRWGPRGTHTTRTIMLDEVRSLFSYCTPDAPRAEYLLAIREENCLGKRTVATRKLCSQRLSELYALDPGVPLFRFLRRFWDADHTGQPLLALLLSLARDPLLRITASVILGIRPGEELEKRRIVDALNRSTGIRFNERTVSKISRNAASSWTQSGHLMGKSRKIRHFVVPTPVTTAYALLIGYLAGLRGVALFESLWAKALDASPDELARLATDARRLGFLDMTQSGGVIEVTFARFLASNERR